MVISLRSFAVLLLVLLVVSGLFGAWQYGENQRLAAENTQLKQQLDDASARVISVERERDQLQGELNQTRQELTDLTASCIRTLRSTPPSRGGWVESIRNVAGLETR